MDQPSYPPAGPPREPAGDRGPPYGPPWLRRRGPGPGGRRPPWWPESESWPPAADWHGVRRRFVRRAGLLLLGFVVLLIALGALSNAFGPQRGGWGSGPHPFFFVLPVLILIAAAALVGGRVLRRTAAPIGDVMEAADRVAGGDYSARVGVRGSGDVRRLLASFNEMAQRLHESDGQRRALLAEVAHELRTPLSVIRGDVEGMLDGLYSRAVATAYTRSQGEPLSADNEIHTESRSVEGHQDVSFPEGENLAVEEAAAATAAFPDQRDREFPQIIRALRNPNFRLFWSGNFLSNIGTWMQNVAQGWLVLSLTGSAFWLGVVGFAGSIPFLMFTLFGGVIADRVNKRRLLLVTQSIMMLLAFALAATWLKIVTVWEVIALAFLNGMAMAMNAPSYQALVPGWCRART